MFFKACQVSLSLPLREARLTVCMVVIVAFTLIYVLPSLRKLPDLSRFLLLMCNKVEIILCTSLTEVPFNLRAFAYDVPSIGRIQVNGFSFGKHSMNPQTKLCQLPFPPKMMCYGFPL